MSRSEQLGTALSAIHAALGTSAQAKPVAVERRQQSELLFVIAEALVDLLAYEESKR